MQDLLVSRDLGKLLTDFHSKGKTTSLACSGLIALLSALPDATTFSAGIGDRRFDEGRELDLCRLLDDRHLQSGRGNR
ncbi:MULTISPECIES: hypothetical protein [Bacteria]|uniref:hypothetical protein n=1 Tax=Exiguobacterium sp. KKBO11 TaxID=1805000 RepID=UPI0018D4C630|nr:MULTISPECIES: hypothetical protein [Bacteria]